MHFPLPFWLECTSLGRSSHTHSFKRPLRCKDGAHLLRIAAWSSQQLAHLRARARRGVETVPRRDPALSTDVQAAIKEADIIFASVNTPKKIKSVDAGHAADLRLI